MKVTTCLSLMRGGVTPSVWWSHLGTPPPPLHSLTPHSLTAAFVSRRRLGKVTIDTPGPPGLVPMATLVKRKG